MNTRRISLILLTIGMIAALVTSAYAARADDDGRGKLVGTWFCDVPTSDTGFPPFQALHTFHSDGTFIETSSLLGLGEEGPAHGVWSSRGRNHALTFQLFGFDPESGQAVIRIIVRVSIQLDGKNHQNARYAVDLIDLEGNRTPNVDTGTYECTRMQVESAP